MVDHNLTEHAQDGTHTDITATSLDSSTFVKSDTISEHTAAAGVTIDGLLVKDSKLATNNSVVTANYTNASVTPDKLATGGSGITVSTSQTTTSTSYADLATATDTVTVTVGANGLALVNIASFIANNTANAKCYVGIAISGASTFAASDAYSLEFQCYAANAEERQAGSFLYTGLTPGSTTFKMKYKVATGGGGSGTGTFADRRITVVPL